MVVNFWFDNWTKLGALYFIENNNTSEEEVEVRDFLARGKWDRQKLLTVLTDEEMIDYICDEVKPSVGEE